MSSLIQHRSHDYYALIRRWKAVAKSSRLRVKKYFSDASFPCFFVESTPYNNDLPAVYISAGIHGDEAGGTEGVIQWAEENPDRLATLNLLIFPCLNPWGLVNNQRTDQTGIDRNRTYQDLSIPATAAHVEQLSGRHFDLALTIHEDYDARGVYLYEVPAKKPFWGEEILRAGTLELAADDRKSIETSRSKMGLIRRKVTPTVMEFHPEAFLLHFNHSKRTFTFETPSEAALDMRVRAHVSMIRRAVNLIEAETQSALVKS